MVRLFVGVLEIRRKEVRFQVEKASLPALVQND